MLKAAAIDVGSSATRLAQLTVSPAGYVAHQELRRAGIRLGHDVFAHGLVLPERQGALVALLRDAHLGLRQAGVRRYRAVATSAMRDAQNGVHIARAVRAACGMRLEIISGAEEGALSRRALLRAAGSVAPSSLLVDLGGGSLEVQQLGHAAGGASLPLGAVRLLALYPELGGALTPAGLAAVLAHVNAELDAGLTVGPAAAHAVGTGGSLEALASILGQPGGAVLHFAAEGLGPLAHRVAPMTLAERLHAFPLHPDRADLFLPAVVVLHALAERCRIGQFVVPRSGLRDSLLVDLLPSSHPSPRDPPMVHACAALFDLLQPLHGLWPPARRGLFALARWHAAEATSARAAGVGAKTPMGTTPTGLPNLNLSGHEAALTGVEWTVLGEATVRLRGLPAQLAHYKQARTAGVWAALVQLAAELASSHCAGATYRLDLFTSPPTLHLGRALGATIGARVQAALAQKLCLR